MRIYYRENDWTPYAGTESFARARVVGGSRIVSSRFSRPHNPSKNPPQFQGYKHTSLTFLVVKSRKFDLGSQKVQKG